MRVYQKHGMTHERIYQIWCDMKQGCLNPKIKHYKDYGGRGITICEEWMTFKPFYDWAMANGYSEKLTIDRINNDKGYYPNNCRWATPRQQVHNQRQRKSKTGVTGVRESYGKYTAYVCIGRKYIQIGRYSSIEEAKNARASYIRRNNI